MKRTNDDKQQAPVPYRLPPARLPTPSQKLPAGCWSTALLLLLLFLLSLALLGCALADVVQKVAEPIDAAGCQADCRIVGLYMSRYEYAGDICWCALEDGGEIKAREFLPALEKGE